MDVTNGCRKAEGSDCSTGTEKGTVSFGSNGLCVSLSVAVPVSVSVSVSESAFAC